VAKLPNFIFYIIHMQIKKNRPSSHKIKCLIYGTPWVGKTTFIWTANNVLIGSAEAGLLSIKREVPYVEIKSVKDLEEVYNYLKNEKHEYETFALDSISEIDDTIKTSLEDRNRWVMTFKERWEKSKFMAAILKKFRDLPMNVIFVAHEKFNKDWENISKYIPMLSGSIDYKAAGFFDIVWRLIVDQDWNRKMIVSNRPNTVTKSRGDYVTDSTPLDFEERLKAFKKIEIKEEEIIANVVETVSNVAEITDQPINSLALIELLNEAGCSEDMIKSASKTLSALEKFDNEKEMIAKWVEIKSQVASSQLFSETDIQSYAKFIDLIIKKLCIK